MDNFYKYLTLPIGTVELVANTRALVQLNFVNGKTNKQQPSEVLNSVANWFEEYFLGNKPEINFPVEAYGTTFQNKVWAQLLKIDYGKTISYKQMAINLGDVKCIRAAASANGKNPIPIIIPCHRVISSDGTLGGYSGGLDKKKKLLTFEGVLPKELF